MTIIKLDTQILKVMSTKPNPTCSVYNTHWKMLIKRKKNTKKKHRGYLSPNQLHQTHIFVDILLSIFVITAMFVRVLLYELPAHPYVGKNHQQKNMIKCQSRPMILQRSLTKFQLYLTGILCIKKNKKNILDKKKKTISGITYFMMLWCFPQYK